MSEPREPSEPAGADPERAAGEDRDEGPGLGPGRLDPDRAADEAGATAGRLEADRPIKGSRGQQAPPAAVVDVRRYRWAIGIFGLAIVVILSIYEFAQQGVGSPGVAPGKPLHRFVAPLATSGLNLDANTSPRCDPGHANPRGLNVCGRAPIVLAFFIPGSRSCTRQVDALQTASEQPRFHGIQFGAVAVHTGRSTAASSVRRHGWTIPVAYDRDGAIGDVYGIEICPIVELARSGGIVVRRLIGEHWTSPAALAAEVQTLVRR